MLKRLSPDYRNLIDFKSESYIYSSLYGAVAKVDENLL